MQKSLILRALPFLFLAGVSYASCPANPSDCGKISAGAITNAAVSYDVRTFGSCIWDGAHDVAPCINLAIAAATANPGTVRVPDGTFNVGTTLSIGTSGVKLEGGGSGVNIDNTVGVVAITRLIWTGAADGTLLDVEPSGSTSLYNTDVTGLVLDCANLAAVCAKFVQVSFSKLDVMGMNARVHDILMTTKSAGFETPGSQNNEIWFQSRANNATYAPTGITLDSGTGCSTNTSYNRIHLLSAAYGKGDGIVFGCTDNNLIENINTIQINAAPNNTGTPVVLANPTYTAPNGYTVNGFAGEGNTVLKTATSGGVQGYQSGSTITPGIHVGSAAVSTIPLVTTALASPGGLVLTFADTTGVLPGMTAKGAAWASGIAPNTQVLNSTGSVTPTTVTIVQGAVGTVAIGTTVTFGYGITIFAALGTYTMTAVDGTHWSLTAPSGGHSQSNIAVASGAITFVDMVIPLTGTPTAGDTFTIVVPRPVMNVVFHSVDKSNNVQNFNVEAGAGIFLDTTREPIPSPIGGSGNIVIQPLNGVLGSTSIGGLGNGVGPAALGGFNGGGTGISVTGFGSGNVAGNGNSPGGTYEFTHGQANTAGGFASEVGGYNGNDRNRYLAQCVGFGAFAVQGDAQSCIIPLRGTGASTTAITLTSDGTNANGNSPNPNCINIPNNTAYALTVTIMAFDHTTVSKNETWLSWGGLLTRGANAASTAVTMQTKPTPLTNGTVTGSDVSITADTTTGCLTTTFTPPTSNTDTWNAAARVQTVEVQ
jgi:hypothetical protein